MERLSSKLRGAALQQLACLSASEAPPKLHDSSTTTVVTTVDRLAAECAISRNVFSVPVNGVVPATETSQVPMSLRELEVLLALCKAAPALQTFENAQKLLKQLSPYMIESYSQRLAPSPFLRDVQPSPWECLTAALTTALLSIGLKFSSLRADVFQTMDSYLRQSLGACQVNVEDVTTLAPLVASLVGFLESAAELANFWTPAERLMIITQVRDALSERFLIDVDDALATLRIARGKNSGQWKRFIQNYDALGRPLGSMLLQRGLVKFLVATTSLLVVNSSAFNDGHVQILDTLMSSRGVIKPTSQEDFANVEALLDLAAASINLVEEESDHSKLGARGQRLVFSIKAYALTAYCNCVILSTSADPNALYKWLQSSIADPVQMSDWTLANVALKSLAVLSKDGNSPPGHISLLHRFIVEGVPQRSIGRVAAKCLSYILQNLPEDATITTLNTLGHVLSSANPESALKGETLQPFEQHPMGSSISLVSNSDEYRQSVYVNVIDAIVCVAATCKDTKMVSLSHSVLIRRLDKVGSTVSAKILTGLASLLLISTSGDFKAALEVYNKMTASALWQKDTIMIEAIMEARLLIANSIHRDHELYELYLVDMLEAIASIGSDNQGDEKRQMDGLLGAREIEQYIPPLAALVSRSGADVNFSLRLGYASLLRDFWLNCAVHGIVYGSEIAITHTDALKTIAKYTPPLITGFKEDESFDKELDERSILIRGLSAENTAEQKKRLVGLLSSNEVDVRTLPYARVIFLEAAYTLECMRAEGGGCAKVLPYFVEPALKNGAASACMVSIAGKVADIYIQKILIGTYPDFSAARVSDQLADIFVACCHRLEKTQTVAMSMADRIVNAVPSALCRRASMYALLELLTLLWISCLERETDEYATRPLFTSALGKVQIEMPDSFDFRNKTLRAFHSKAKLWVTKVLNVAHLDVKGLLQTYLSEFEDEASYGRVSLGRTFALEMGGAVPNSDQRLASIDFLGECNANISSDFVKQYTVRQAYRHGEPTAHYRHGIRLKSGDSPEMVTHSESVNSVLSQIASKDWELEHVPADRMKDVLRKAASLICRSEQEEGALIRHLVRIPFSVFSKESIKLGMVLWVGVMNERPSLQSRMLAEITRNFERTIEEKIGLFAQTFCVSDPFEVGMEYAPSNKDDHLLEQKTAGDMLSPHLRLLQLLSSHYHATRHGNPHIQRIFLRFLRIALVGLKHATGHPLAREARFQLLLFGLQVLRYTTGLTEKQQLKLKDLILSGGLSWFQYPPRWTFGGNRLQVKAEAHLLQDVANLLNTVASIGGNNKALRMKHDLLLLLVENESTRLATWLYPLDHSRKHHRLPNYSIRPATDNTLSVLLPTAWAENPAIVIQLVRRFQSTRLASDVRRYILSYPENVAHISDAAQIMLSSRLSGDLTFQLRYLLFWAPVDPITAATFFLPAYGNNPFILQYAMRSLESHSVDITFFYVPQIVQTLRYDSLGYVMRFIIETAKFSQLFAHQIIWNIKANSYKDEDSQIPDSVKPTLDTVEDRLIKSFSPADKNFYDREFSFFNDVTSISGKLRPYLRKTKPEKNQKIAEELQKIKIDIGVYLPSNPDSVVIDIDRTSGKSLQSHAKTPFMATFKIRRKTIGAVDESSPPDHRGRRHESTSTVMQEKMQAAIFKVGDDCRQDMLALQLISCFRSIFNSVGLDVYVFPYRVTATAPGCGVIDVLPKSISRDMLGRDYEMGLYDYFINKYGGEDSIAFQNARNSFVKSMAAYSVISYLLKFKDRHNGNIMVDDAGHILHIDFGFCFDIAPGGITFERAPFKLTGEMISVMGGSTDSQTYLWFEELCIKSFLASRLYVDKLTYCVILMLDSGLPCFKPETIQNFRDRFVLDKTEREAADYMRYLIKRSYSSYSTGQYDRFQHLTNGIPY